MIKYKTQEERKAAKAEWNRKYRETHKAEIAEYNRKWRETPIGRASYLLSTYQKMDKNKGFVDCIDFDARWIVENIFTKKCKYCDCTDWKQLGCNRIDNNKPHIKSNVEPCCWKHNTELAHEEQSIPVAQFDKISGELVAVWSSESEAAKELGYNHSNICNCCNGNLPHAYGFVWRKLIKDE